MGVFVIHYMYRTVSHFLQHTQTVYRRRHDRIHKQSHAEDQGTDILTFIEETA
jgi:hypothetical protein